MTDPTFDRLARLSPTVDTSAARRSFATRRRRARRQRRAVVAVAAVVVVAAGTGIVIAVMRSTPETITSAPPVVDAPTSSSNTGNTSSPASTTAETVGPTSSPLVVAEDGRAGPAVVGEPSDTIAEALVRGVVVFDLGCVRLDAEFGGRFIVVWPAGTQWDDAAGDVVLADGRRVPMGAAIEGPGGYYSADDMAANMPSVGAALRSCLPPGVGPDTAAQVVITNPDTIAPTPGEVAAPAVTTSVVPEPLVRPIVDAPYCSTVGAGEGTLDNLRFFARSSARPVPRQVLGDPAGDLSRPYAVVQRYFDGQYAIGEGMAVTDINGLDGSIRVNAFGGGEARWILPDGSEAYIRSRGLDATQLTELARALTARPADAAVPAFDVTGALPAGMEMVAETPGPIAGSGAGSMCELPSGAVIIVSVLRGDPLYAYLLGLDAPWPPLLVRQGDAVVSILVPRDGQPDPTAVLADVRNASDEEWATILAQGSGGIAFDG